MSREDVAVNRNTIASMAHFCDVQTLCAFYGHARRSMLRLGIGFANNPPDSADPALDVVDPAGTMPSLIDIAEWMDSIHWDSDSDYDSDSDDDSVDVFEFLSRLYSTLDARVPPTYKANLIALE